MTEQRVSPYGPFTAEVAFVGQSPGKIEGEEGRPFVGKAGQLLRELCIDVGIDPNDCFWTNICDRVLLGSEEPTPKDIVAGKKRLRIELEQLHKLKLIVMVGTFAASVVFTGSMGEMSGKEGFLFGIPCTAIYHPSAVLRAGRADGIAYKTRIKRVLHRITQIAPIMIKPTYKSKLSRLLTPSLVVETISDSKSEDWLRLLIDETLERQQPLWHPPSPFFRGSEVADPCLRSLVLGAMGHNMPVEARLRRIFNTGISIEHSNVNTLHEAGIIDGESQTEIIYKDPPIIGHVDVLIKRPRDGKRIIGEIKSIREELWKKLPPEHGLTLAGQSPLLNTHRRYVLQWNTYVCAPNVNLNEGFILFEAKNTQKQKFFWLIRDDNLMEETLNRLRLAAPYILSNPMRVPPISLDPDEDDTHKNCPRRYLCMRVPDEGATYDEVREIDAGIRG